MPPLAVYVHFPYCLKKCPYCDFFSLTAGRDEIPHAGYADAVIAEADRRIRELGPHTLGSVFFGGGTPSLWQSDELARVIERLCTLLPRSGDTEITVECNPSSFDAAKAEALACAGVNRVSLGVQGLDAERLQFLGRLHDGPGALAALGAALGSRVPRVSADLIFGVAGQTAKQAEAEASRLAALGPTHLSAYALTIEPGTEFGARAKRGSLPLLADDVVARSYELVESALENAGFEHYEISNYARSGHYAAHNLAVWRGEPYLGLGAGAVGTVRSPRGRVRYRNARSAERYLSATQDSESELWQASALVADAEHIAPETELVERLLLGLRLARGVDLGQASRATGAPGFTPERERATEKLVRAGRLEREGDCLRIPKRAWLFADAVIRELL